MRPCLLSDSIRTFRIHLSIDYSMIQFVLLSHAVVRYINQSFFDSKFEFQFVIRFGCIQFNPATLVYFQFVIAIVVSLLNSSIWLILYIFYLVIEFINSPREIPSFLCYISRRPVDGWRVRADIFLFGRRISAAGPAGVENLELCDSDMFGQCVEESPGKHCNFSWQLLRLRVSLL